MSDRPIKRFRRPKKIHRPKRDEYGFLIDPDLSEEAKAGLITRIREKAEIDWEETRKFFFGDEGSEARRKAAEAANSSSSVPVQWDLIDENRRFKASVAKIRIASSTVAVAYVVAEEDGKLLAPTRALMEKKDGEWAIVATLGELDKINWKKEAGKKAGE